MWCILNLHVAHEWSWTYRKRKCWLSISNQDKHISIQAVLIYPHIKIRAHIYTRTKITIVCDYLYSIFRLLLGVEDTEHVTIEQYLMNLLFSLFSCSFVSLFFFNLHTLTLVCIFSVLIPIHSLRSRQRQFAWQSRASIAGDHFFYSWDLNVLFRGEIVRRILILGAQKFNYTVPFITFILLTYPPKQHPLIKYYNWG